MKIKLFKLLLFLLFCLSRKRSFNFLGLNKKAFKYKISFNFLLVFIIYFIESNEFKLVNTIEKLRLNVSKKYCTHYHVLNYLKLYQMLLINVNFIKSQSDIFSFIFCSI